MSGQTASLPYIDTTIWYSKYLNFPYIHLGDNPETGIDCFNLCRLIYREELNIDIPYDTSEWCKETARGNWDKRNIDAYDGLVMSLFEKKA